jgi:hypothetical protein
MFSPPHEFLAVGYAVFSCFQFRALKWIPQPFQGTIFSLKLKYAINHKMFSGLIIQTVYLFQTKKITKFVFIAVLEIPGRPIVNDNQKR